MPAHAPRRRCTTPGCPDPAETGGKCKQHRARGGGNAEQFYNSRSWRALSAKIRDRDRICPGWPTNTRCGRRTTEVDHIIEIEDGGDHWDEANLMALCRSCHQAKTMHERSKRRNA